MANLTSNFALGWDASKQIHNSAKVKVAVLGDAFGYLMEGGNTETQRFAATVLDAINFTNGAGGNSISKLGKFDSKISKANRRDLDYLHHHFAKQIYEYHLAMPFMSDDELSEYLLRETLEQKPEYLDLLTKDVFQEFNIKLCG